EEAVETLRNGDDGVEQSWTFAREPEGQGALDVSLEVQGLSYRGSTQGGLHFVDTRSSLGVRYGHGIWVDAAGRRTPVPARFSEGRIHLRVPAEVLASSSYPAVLDPLISPELSLDTPTLRPSPGGESHPAIAFNGTVYLACWGDHHYPEAAPELVCTRIRPDGTVLDLEGLSVGPYSGASDAPNVASNGTDFLVVWSLYPPNSTSPGVVARRVSGSGAVLGASPVFMSSAPAGEYNPSVAYTNFTYLVVWSDFRFDSQASRIVGARVSNGGTVLDPSGIAISPGSSFHREPTVAADGTLFLVVWTDDRNSSSTGDDLYSTLVSSGGILLNPGTPVITAAGGQSEPALTPTDSGYILAWADTRNGVSAIYSSRLSTQASPLDGTGLRLSTSTRSQRVPQVATSSSGALAVWKEEQTNSSTIAGARLSSTGQVLGSITLSSTAYDGALPAIASNGTDYLVGWEERLHDDTSIFGRRVSGSGTLLDPRNLTLSTEINDERLPKVATNGSTFLAVWMDDRSGLWEVYAAYLDSSGAPLKPPMRLGQLTTGSYLSPPGSVAVASNGTNYLVVWSTNDLFNTSDIHGARVSAEGEPLGPAGFVISNAANAQLHPDVASNGNNYLVAWEDLRGGGHQDLYAARVGANGTVADPTGIPLSTATLAQTEAAVASNGVDYFVAWRDERQQATRGDIYGTRVTGTGTVVDVTGIPISTAALTQQKPAITWDGQNYTLAWEDGRGGTAASDIFAARVSSAGAVLDPQGVAVCTDAQAQTVPTVAARGSSTLVAWLDARGSVPEVYGALLSTQGGVQPLNGEGLTLSANSMPRDAPALTRAGDRGFLLAYSVRDTSLRHDADRARLRFVRYNAPPAATSQSLTVVEDRSLSLTLAGSDPDGDGLTFSLTSAPAHGTLSGTPPQLSYTPAPDFHGADSFTFTVSDGHETSAPSTVSLSVSPVNDPPVATAVSRVTAEDTAVSVTLAGTDVDGDGLSFLVVTQPAHGILSGTPPQLTYTPASHFNGSDSFTFLANDGSALSAPGTVQLTITPVPDAPVARSQSRSTPAGQPLSLTLEGDDPEGDMLTFSVVTQPAHGTLSGTPPQLTYTPAAGFQGSDSFTFQARDAADSSAPATVSIQVVASSTPDAGTPDAGTPDSGTPDSGTPDSGTPDSGIPDSPNPSEGGCGCSGAPSGMFPLALLVLLAWRGRSPRRREAERGQGE
ncbi:Ig-like domain-containing protein, partial [Hyalangium sp.]|uniref:Ig-like domain-containing protein n=1 Tax=Hyalangium sp. TaxID=2028555 RepID=UPI002D456BC0